MRIARGRRILRCSLDGRRRLAGSAPIVRVEDALRASLAQQERFLQRFVTRIVLLEKSDEVQQIGIVERTVLETQQCLQVGILMTGNELIGSAVHSLNQLPTLVDNRLALPPSENGGHERHDFDILLAREGVRDANGIVVNEAKSVVLRNLAIEKRF